MVTAGKILRWISVGSPSFSTDSPPRLAVNEEEEVEVALISDGNGYGIILLILAVVGGGGRVIPTLERTKDPICKSFLVALRC